MKTLCIEINKEQPEWKGIVEGECHCIREVVAFWSVLK